MAEVERFVNTKVRWFRADSTKRLALSAMATALLSLGCTPNEPPSPPSLEPLVVHPLGNNPEWAAAAEITGDMLTIDGDYVQVPCDESMCSNGHYGDYRQTAVVRRPSDGQTVELARSGSALKVDLKEVAISPNGRFGAILSEVCLRFCEWYSEHYTIHPVTGEVLPDAGGYRFTKIRLQIFDLASRAVIDSKDFANSDCEIGRRCDNYPQPVNMMQISDGGNLVVWQSQIEEYSAWSLRAWRRDTGEVQTFDGSFPLRSCADEKSFVAVRQSEVYGVTQATLFHLDGSASEPFTAGNGDDFLGLITWSFTSNCTAAWRGGGGALDIIDRNGSIRSIAFPGAYKVAASDDLGTALVVQRLSDSQWEYWRYSTGSPENGERLASSKYAGIVQGASLSRTGGGIWGVGAIGNRGAFSVVGGPNLDELFVLATRSVGGCSLGSVEAERPTLNRRTDFVLSTSSPLRIEVSAAAGCRSSLEVVASRLSADPTSTHARVFEEAAGFRSAPASLPVNTTWTINGSGIAAIPVTFPASALEPGTYEFIAKRTDATGGSPVLSAPVRVKVVSPQLELLDRVARSAMNSTGDPRWSAVAKADRQFSRFEPAGTKTRVVEVLGDLDSASNIAVQIPGFGETASDRYRVNDEGQVTAGQGAWNSERIWAEASREERFSTAVISWLGYDAPFENVLSDNAARSGARELVGDLASLGVVSSPGNRLTLVGHSYGSLVAALALMAENLEVSDLVVVGSPGLDIREFADTKFYQTYDGCDSECGPYKFGVEALENVGPGNVWAAAADDDTITSVAWDTGEAWFGAAPHFDEFGANEFHTEQTGWLRGSYGHSEYFEVQSTSLYNIAQIVSGRYGSVIVRDYSPFSQA